MHVIHAPYTSPRINAPGMSRYVALQYVFTISFTSSQGLTLVHFSAQLEPCLTQENTLHTLNTP